MITLAVDDITDAAHQICDMMKQIDPEGEHHALSDAGEALKSVETLRPDVVWLDIEMPGQNGLETAVGIKRISPDTNIVFVTGYPQYAVDAFGMHVSGFVLKPVTEEKLKRELEDLRHTPEKRKDSLLRIQCFGNFEVFAKDRIVRFSRSLSKEALAYLVDRRGAGCSVGEICSVLWEERHADKNLKSQCRVVLAALRKDLEAAGADDVIVKTWNMWSLDISKTDCDYYNYLKGDIKAVNSFRGEYMAQYSWAEMTAGVLYDIKKEDTLSSVEGETVRKGSL